MSEEPITVSTQIEGIDVYDEDTVADMNGSVGHVDVIYHLERGEDVLGFASVRVYFTRKDVPLDQLVTAARAEGHQVLSRIAERYEPAPADAGPERLWKQ